MSDGPGLLPEADPRRPVPWRTILATVFVVGVALVGWELLQELSRLVAWIVVAGFLAVVLTPAVDYLQHRGRLRRGAATAIVFLVGFGLLAGMLYTFIRPIVDQVSEFVDDLPELVDEAQRGEGWAGELVERYDIEDWVEENRDRWQEALSSAGAPALDIVRSVFNTVFAVVTILVLTVLMLQRGPDLTKGTLALVPPRHRDRVRLVAGDAARAVSGYMLGNFLISLVAGLSTYAVLKILGVEYAEVLALWVAFADLIPMVGATLGAIPTIGVSFLHSTPAGIAAFAFYVIYQQFENHVLQVTIMSRTVDVNPLTVLISVLAGVELFGFVGALLAIPFAGVVQVIVRNVYDERLGHWKEVPTVGTDEIPATSTEENGR